MVFRTPTTVLLLKVTLFQGLTVSPQAHVVILSSIILLYITISVHAKVHALTYVVRKWEEVEVEQSWLQ